MARDNFNAPHTYFCRCKQCLAAKGKPRDYAVEEARAKVNRDAANAQRTLRAHEREQQRLIDLAADEIALTIMLNRLSKPYPAVRNGRAVRLNDKLEVIGYQK